MTNDTFNCEIADAQATPVTPVEPAAFDMERYADYEARLLESNEAFWKAGSGLAVYRRFRPAEVFAYGCRDMKRSLSLQLGALTESMRFSADVANFLEPWYGIGVVASSFGCGYEWPAGQAPVIKPPFKTVRQAVEYRPTSVEATPIGKQTLRTIEYFVEMTKGRIPMSLTDTQSPMDTASLIVDNNNFFMSFVEDPESVAKLLDIITELLVDFTRRQIDIIGDALASPGHGFASSRRFSGLGASDDVSMMLSAAQYSSLEAPVLAKLAEAFGGAAFHSCGDWSSRAGAVAETGGLVMVDGAFSRQTDPNPNPPEAFGDVFAGTGIAVNARIVGDEHCVLDRTKRLFKPDMKLIAVTYCKTPAEQQRTYEQLHALAE